MFANQMLRKSEDFPLIFSIDKTYDQCTLNSNRYGSMIGEIVGFTL